MVTAIITYIWNSPTATAAASGTINKDYTVITWTSVQGGYTMPENWNINGNQMTGNLNSIGACQIAFTMFKL